MNKYALHSDEQLFALLKTGSESAFEELYNRYWQKLFVIAAKRLESQFEAEEVVQDIFFNIWKLRHNLDLHTSAAAYLATAVKFQVFNRIAKRKQMRSFSASIPAENYDNNNAIRQLQLTDLQHILNKTVNKLPDQCRIVYKLSREEGYSRREIAHTLQISEKTVANHLTRALNTLRTVLHLAVLIILHESIP